MKKQVRPARAQDGDAGEQRVRVAPPRYRSNVGHARLRDMGSFSSRTFAMKLVTGARSSPFTSAPMSTPEQVRADHLEFDSRLGDLVRVPALIIGGDMLIQ